MKLSVTIPDGLWALVVASRGDDFGRAGASRVLQDALHELVLRMPAETFAAAYNTVVEDMRVPLDDLPADPLAALVDLRRRNRTLNGANEQARSRQSRGKRPVK